MRPMVTDLTPEDMRALISVGVDGIMTDFPDRLVAALNENK